MIFDPRRRADGAHPEPNMSFQFEGSAVPRAVAAAGDVAPSDVLARQCPQAVERLEQLDDAVFEAIAGRPQALDEFKQLWPRVVRELSPELVEESRVQYLRHAMEMWKHCVEGDELRNPQVAVSTMDVIQILLEPLGR